MSLPRTAPRTAWKAGQSGNPGGRWAEREFATMLRVAVRDVVDPVSKKIKLRAIAEQLVDQAVAGDLTAISMVADRLDGKPISEHVSTSRGIVDMSDQELLAIVVEAQTIEHEPLDNVTPMIPDKKGDT